VEQLSKVDPSCMNCDERLAFWVNLYNALIMHVSMYDVSPFFLRMPLNYLFRDRS
jgi:hypothetical protein